jgi:hypothetical protein
MNTTDPAASMDDPSTGNETALSDEAVQTMLVVGEKAIRVRDALRALFRDPACALPDPIDNMRARYIGALLLVGKFLEGIGTEKDVAESFAQLGGALLDLEQGTRHPLLEPKKFGNRAPTTSEVWYVRACLVCVLDWLAAAGMDLESAAAIIAKRGGRSLDSVLERGSSLEKAILGWRTSLEKGRIKSGSVEGLIEQNRRLLEAVAPHFPRAEIQRVALNKLDDVAKRAGRIVARPKHATDRATRRAARARPK